MTMTEHTTKRLEVIALDADDAREAQAGGADSLEIVRELALGGLTPSFETLRAIREAVPLQLNVIIRPHARDFVYSPSEADVILRDAQEAMHLGADGIVFGALTPDASADLALFDQVAALCRSINPGVIMTFHRAIEAVRDPEPALEALCGRADRVLCSGLPSGAPDDAPRTLLRDWVRAYGTQIHFACGGGVSLASLGEAVRLTGAPEYHVGGAARSNGKVDRLKVRALVQALG